MAEAEDVIVDAARHATVFARRLWQRHHAGNAGPRPLQLADVSQRLDLLIAAAFERSFTLRVAQPPALPTALARLFRRSHGPIRRAAVPATDGHGIWLPAELGPSRDDAVLARFRAIALQQAMRAVRGSAEHSPGAAEPLLRDLYLLLESHAADAALARRLPGTEPALTALRRAALAQRPPLSSFPSLLQPLEGFARRLLGAHCAQALPGIPLCDSPVATANAAQELAAQLYPQASDRPRLGAHPLLLDAWTGELRPPPMHRRPAPLPPADADLALDAAATRSARLARRPEVREADEDEDDAQPGAWMVQTAQPHETAEDGGGLQRPTDRDGETAAEEFADAMSELAQARLVTTPGRPKEVLLSDDPPEARARGAAPGGAHGELHLHYPEWDHRLGAYRDPGATVHLLPPRAGAQKWVDDTLAQHRSMLNAIRRHFELLRAQRLRLRKQLDGDELDLEACIDSHADFRAGLPRSQALYLAQRRARRDMAILLLIDVSGSTDSWISAQRRIIDVEREALLLVCIALEGMAEPYSVLAFSGEGPQAVSIRSIKRFDEAYGDTIAQRIAALEPEQYTRAGAAIRHATTLLMRQPAHHRLLLLLSDGKPNDIDHYEGRYGVEDMRQAVTEAKLQGIFPFCLTIDRQGASYLPAVFGPGQYALMARPESLPTALLDWMRRLTAA